MNNEKITYSLAVDTVTSNQYTMGLSKLWLKKDIFEGL
jgi:hypothetical protein